MDSERRDDATTLMRTRFEPTPLPEGTFSLVVTAGVDAGKRFDLDGSLPAPWLLGQSPACALRLTDRQVSRRHLALEPVGARVRVTDLGSTNGTFVGGVPVVDAFLENGALLSVGATTLRLDHVPEAAVPAPPLATSFGELEGVSTEMRRLYPFFERLATSTITALIEGETGTGKEVLARSIHARSPRANGPFVVFDCTAVPPNLVESELFGHERGAFTGAVAARRGVFELAHGGTLLIDEIGDLEPSLQPRLLRAIERCELRRVGAERSIEVDVRVLAATRRNLDVEVQAGRFRDDLFHRLAVARVELPPLRRRKGDVTRLARHFCAELGGDPEALPSELLLRWEDYAWPGNVRELRNAVERHLVFGETMELAAADAEGRALGSEPPSGAGDMPADGTDAMAAVLAEDLPLVEARKRVVAEFERRYVQRAIARHGSVTRAAAAAGIPRRYFQIIKARIKK